MRLNRFILNINDSFFRIQSGVFKLNKIFEKGNLCAEHLPMLGKFENISKLHFIKLNVM